MTILQLTLGIITVLTVVSTGAATLLMVTVKTLRESNADLKDRVELLEKLREADAEKIAVLTSDRDAFRRSALNMDAREAHHDLAVAHWKREETALSHLSEVGSKILAAVTKAWEK